LSDPAGPPGASGAISKPVKQYVFQIEHTSDMKLSGWMDGWMDCLLEKIMLELLAWKLVRYFEFLGDRPFACAKEAVSR
jgi:hypothetical protein